MLKSMQPTSPDAHDDHLKRLLDQRATRADVRPRFPSSASDFSDSPSIYSHAYFSPRPTARDQTTTATDYNAAERPSLEKGNTLNDLAMSMLDDRRSSYASTIMDDFVSPRVEPEDDTDIDALDMRMSMLGPKMRVHSKAPWELDEDPLEEEDEDDATSSRGRPSPVRSAFGFGAKRGIFGRTSGESSIPKRSFESTNTPYSRNTAYSEHTNNSATSLLYPSQHLAEPAPSFVSSSAPTSPISPPLPPSKHIVDSPESLRISKPLSPVIDNALYRQDSHPYANPDLYEDVARPTLPVRLPHSPRSESISTIRDAQPPAPLPKDAPPPGSPWPGASKGISSPMTLNSKPSNDSVLAGWSENTPSPGFSLISLEEARQAQHARSVTASSTRTSDSSTDEAANVRSRSRLRTMSAGSRAKQAINNMVGGNVPERRESEPVIVASGSGQGKSLKHKKSGLMRLFNAGRDEKESPPPVPSVQDGVAKYNAHHVVPPRTPKLSNASPHRVPVPSISPPSSPPTASRPERVVSPKPLPPPLLITSSSSKGILLSPGATSSTSEELLVPPRLHFADECSQSAPPQATSFPALKLRPVSSLFSTPFGEHILAPSDAPTPQLPSTSSFESDRSDPEATIRSLQDQLSSSNKSWQQQVWELQGQIRDLKAELDDVNAQDVKNPCKACGRGRKSSMTNSSTSDSLQVGGGSVVNRPRARVGNAGVHSRFGAGL